MEIFKYTRFGGEPCDIESTFKTLLANDDLVLININPIIQKKLSCRFRRDVFIDKPWKTISKQAVLDDIQAFGEESSFYPYREQIKNMKDPEILIGFDTSNVEGEDSFYVCLTSVSKNKIIEELKALHENHMKFIAKAYGMETKPWTDLGSSEEIGLDIAVNNRPLISFEYLGMKNFRFEEPKFSNLDAGTNPHTYACIKNPRDVMKQITALCANKAIQAAMECKESYAQTIPEIPVNASTQFNPEIEAKEKEDALNEPIDDKIIAEVFKKYEKKIFNALDYNAEYDLYKNDYEELAKSGQLLQIYPFLEYKHFVTFTDIVSLKKKYITDTSWHPKYSGIVAVSYGNEVLCESLRLESNSDDSDFEYKPTPPKVFEPKLEKKKLIGEITHAKAWMRSVVSFRRTLGKKEDESLYTLAAYTLKFLCHSQLLRTTILELENKFEESIPELDDLDFEEEFEYEEYKEKEDQPTSEEVIQKLQDLPKLSHYENESLDFGNPIPYLSTKFEEALRNYKPQEKVVPTVDEMRTFNTVWDGKQWNLGETLKDDALTVHKRHINEAQKLVGKVLLAPRNKAFFPFCKRIKPKIEKPAQVGTLKDDTTSYVTTATMESRVKPGGGPNLAETVNKGATGTVVSYESLPKPKAAPSVGFSGSQRSETSNTPHLEKKKRDIYREISDDEDEEKNNTFNILSSEHPIMIWWLDNDLKAILYLDCPQEVHSIEFCPHNGDILVGGTVTGQIVLWDLQGRIPPTSTSLLKDTGEKVTYKELKRKMAWFKDLRVPRWVKYCAITSLNESHRSKVVNIQWVPPTFEMNMGYFMPLKEDQNYSAQIVSTSLDGEIKFWDLNMTPKPKQTSRHIERLVGIRSATARPAALIKNKSQLAKFHKRWPPKYSISCLSPMNLPLQITSIQFEPRLLAFERVTPINPQVKDKMTDVIEYKLKPHYETEKIIKQNAFLGTMSGDVAFVEWKGKSLMGETEKPGEAVVVKSFASIHDGPVTGVARHPFIDNIAMSTGGHIYAIWNTRDMTWPIMWKRYFGLTVACCSWSPLRPSLYRIGRSDGFVEIWDLILQSHEAKIFIPAAGQRVTGFSSPLLKLPKGLLGVADSKASLILLYIPWFYQLWKKAELDKLTEIFAREPARRENLKKWAETWRSMHISRYAQREGMDKMKLVAKKKKIEFDPNTKTDCKKYYQELYKWYLRRRKRTPPWILEIEQRRKDKEQEYMVNTILANKGVNLELLRKQMSLLVKKEARLKAKEEKVLEMLGEADKIFQIAAKQIFIDPEHSKKASQISLRIGVEDTYDIADTLNEIDLLFGADGNEFEKEYDENVKEEYREEELCFPDLVEKCKPSREVFNDRRRWRDPRNRWLREIVKNELESKGISFRQWENHKTKYIIKKYKKRVKNLKQLQKIYGKTYDPLWDFDNRPTSPSERCFDKSPEKKAAPTEEAEVEVLKRKEFFPYRAKPGEFFVDESSALDLEFLSNPDNIDKMFVREHALQYSEKENIKKGRRKKLIKLRKLKESEVSVDDSLVSSSSLSIIEADDYRKKGLTSVEKLDKLYPKFVEEDEEEEEEEEEQEEEEEAEEMVEEEEADKAKPVESEKIEELIEEELSREEQLEKLRKIRDLASVRKIIAGRSLTSEIEFEDNEDYEFMEESAIGSQDELIYSGDSIPSPGSSPPSGDEESWFFVGGSRADHGRDLPFVEHFEGPPPCRYIPQVQRKPAMELDRAVPEDQGFAKDDTEEGDEKKPAALLKDLSKTIDDKLDSEKSERSGEGLDSKVGDTPESMFSIETPDVTQTDQSTKQSSLMTESTTQDVHDDTLTMKTDSETAVGESKVLMKIPPKSTDEGPTQTEGADRLQELD